MKANEQFQLRWMKMHSNPFCVSDSISFVPLSHSFCASRQATKECAKRGNFLPCWVFMAQLEISVCVLRQYLVRCLLTQKTGRTVNILHASVRSTVFINEFLQQCDLSALKTRRGSTVSRVALHLHEHRSTRGCWILFDLFLLKHIVIHLFQGNYKKTVHGCIFWAKMCVLDVASGCKSV